MPLEEVHKREIGTTRFIHASKSCRWKNRHSNPQVARGTDTTAAFGLITGGKGGAAQPEAKWWTGGGCKVKRPGGPNPTSAVCEWACVAQAGGWSPPQNLLRKGGAPRHRPGAKIKSRAWRSAAATLGCQRSTMNTARGPSSAGPGGAKRREVGPGNGRRGFPLLPTGTGEAWKTPSQSLWLRLASVVGCVQEGIVKNQAASFSPALGLPSHH